MVSHDGGWSNPMADGNRLLEHMGLGCLSIGWIRVAKDGGFGRQ